VKVILLHLSDIHIKSSGDNPVLFHAQHIAAATASIAADAEQCFVAVTGDIAFSGAEDEYRLADRFFTSLRDELSDRLPECECHLVVVPGTSRKLTNSVPSSWMRLVLSISMRASTLNVSAFKKTMRASHPTGLMRTFKMMCS